MSKEDDVRKYVIRREIPAKAEGGKVKSKAPKIQRLVTPIRLQRKRQTSSEKRKKLEKSRAEYQAYHKLLAARAHEQKEHRAETLSKRKRSISHTQ